MSKTSRLTNRQIRQVSELLGEVKELGADAKAWRTHALRGLINLTHAQVGLTLDTMNALPGKLPSLVDPIDIGWRSIADSQTYYEYYRQEIVEDPAASEWVRLHQHMRFITTTRRQLLGDEHWYSSFSVSELRRFAGVDDFVLSSVALGQGMLHGFIIYRPWGAPPHFGLRERRLMRLFHIWLLRLYKKSLAVSVPQEVAGLPPRVRQMLDLLLAGRSVKEAAAQMGVSRHTANDYAKKLHHRLGVETRSELLARYLPTRRVGCLALPAGMPEIPRPANPAPGSTPLWE